MTMLDPDQLKKVAETATKAAEQAVPTKPAQGGINIGGDNNAPFIGGNNNAPIYNVAGPDTLGKFVAQARPWALRFLIVSTAAMLAASLLRMYLVYRVTGGWDAMDAWFIANDPNFVPHIILAGFWLGFLIVAPWYLFTSDHRRQPTTQA